MANNNFLIILFLFTSLALQSQSESNSKLSGFFEIVDSLFIDHDIENYSIRAFTNYKVKKFELANDDYESRYLPNNRFGLGFGFASSKILIDIAFNVKSGKKEATDRFDAQGSIVLKNRHYLNGFLQAYRGFNIRNNFNEPYEFRNDIKSRTLGLNYLFTISEIEFSYSLLKAGLIKPNKKIYINGGIGGFMVFDYFSSNSTIMSENGLLYFNEQADIKSSSQRAFGILGGFLSAFILPNNFIATFNVMPGIAVVSKKVTIQDDFYRPSKPLLYKMDIDFALSYNVDRYYINLTYGTGIYKTDLDFNNKYRFNLSMAKLAFGYKL